MFTIRFPRPLLVFPKISIPCNLQALISTLNVYVQDSRNKLKKYDIYSRVTKKMPIYSKNNMAAWIKKMHLKKLQRFWKIILSTHGTKEEIFDIKEE